jgi:hypothetical protein
MPSTSPESLNSNAVLVCKSDGNLLFCFDYRHINALMETVSTPLPKIDEALGSLGNAQYFSNVDLTSGFFQIPLDESSRDVSSDVLELFCTNILGLDVTTDELLLMEVSHRLNR